MFASAKKFIAVYVLFHVTRCQDAEIMPSRGAAVPTACDQCPEIEQENSF
jgi:hypothetical protein